MPFGSTAQSVAIAGAVCGVVSVAVGMAIHGGLFHKFQRLTPGTWRPEAGSRYATGVLARLVVGAGFPLLFAYTGMPRLPDLKESPLWQTGAMFGMLCWGALALPMTLSVTNFVNVHRGFVLGLMVDWLVVGAASGVACAYLVHAG